MKETTLERIRSARQAISAEYSHNVQQVTAYYISRQNKRNRSFPAKSYTVEKTQERFARAYQPWTADEEARLRQEFLRGASIQELTQLLCRQPGGITSRLRRLGLVE